MRGRDKGNQGNLATDDKRVRFGMFMVLIIDRMLITMYRSDSTAVANVMQLLLYLFIHLSI